MPFSSQVEDNNKPRLVVLFGPPGAGKGTQAEFLNTRVYALGKDSPIYIPISTSALFEKLDPQSEIGVKVAKTRADGNLVGDDIVLDMLTSDVSSRIENKTLDLTYQVVLGDGFPRTVYQAERLSDIFNVSLVLHYNLREEEAIKRILGRAIESGANARKDDKLEAAIVRMEKFRTETLPALGYYNTETNIPVVTIDAMPGKEKLHTLTKAILETYLQ